MALSDKDVNAALEMFSQRCMEDPEFAEFAEENPIAAFDQMVQTRQAEVSKEENTFPLPVSGTRLSQEELEKCICG